MQTDSKGVDMFPSRYNRATNLCRRIDVINWSVVIFPYSSLSFMEIVHVEERTSMWTSLKGIFMEILIVEGRKSTRMVKILEGYLRPHMAEIETEWYRDQTYNGFRWAMSYLYILTSSRAWVKMTTNFDFDLNITIWPLIISSQGYVTSCTILPRIY